MKRVLHLFFPGFMLNLMTSANSFARQYPQPNAEWTYCTGDPELPIVYLLDVVKLYYTRDTLISGTTYNVVEPEINTVSNYNKYFTRYSNDTIYRWINDTEYLYFHFNLSVGEVITTFRSIAGTSDTSCSSLLPLEVIDSGTVSISGEDLIW
ncbi:hypothetical protein JYT72_00860 [Crocinitomix catalasitica]|nr:hypothetical protein [Crocinitomix catalasitica]